MSRENIKPTRTFSAFIALANYIHTYISKVHTMLLSRELKNQKVRHHAHQNKKVSVFKSEILRKYKRIKWTSSRKVPLTPRDIISPKYSQYIVFFS